MLVRTHHSDGTVTEHEAPSSSPQSKTTGLVYDEFRKTLTQSELTLLDNALDDDAMTALGKTPLTTAQKITFRTLLAEAQATGGGRVGINLGSPKMSAALDAIIAMGLIAEARKPEIVGGTVKS